MWSKIYIKKRNFDFFFLYIYTKILASSPIYIVIKPVFIILKEFHIIYAGMETVNWGQSFVLCW